MSTIVRVTDDTTRAELAETLALLNAEAKALTRRGHTGTRSAEYAAWHERIDALLEEWQQAGPNCRTCGRTKAVCDAEPRACCDVCRENGHG